MAAQAGSPDTERSSIGIVSGMKYLRASRSMSVPDTVSLILNKLFMPVSYPRYWAITLQSSSTFLLVAVP